MAEENKNLENEELENEEVEDQNDESGKDSNNDDDKAGKDSNKKDTSKSGKTFTQEQVNRMMTREKNQGRAAALKELGVDPKDSKMVAMVKALIESQKTDEQKTAEKEREEQEKQAENDRRVAVAEAKAEAMMMGVKSQYVEDAVALALTKVTDDNNDIKTILGELKTKYPIWFGESSDDDDKEGKKGKTGQKGTGSSIKSGDKGQKKGDEGKGLGARLAAQRKSSAKKSSYWGKN